MFRQEKRNSIVHFVANGFDHNYTYLHCYVRSVSDTVSLLVMQPIVQSEPSYKPIIRTLDSN